MGRRGKIARLPREIREQVNHKLDEGQFGDQIMAWLNALPETQAVLAAEFDGRPIIKQNLSEWRTGGYREWRIGQEAMEAMRRLAGDDGLVKKNTQVPLVDLVAAWAMARYMVEAEELKEGARDVRARWKLVRAFLKDVARMRQGDYNAERLKLKREWLKFTERMQGLKQPEGAGAARVLEPENREGITRTRLRPV